MFIVPKPKKIKEIDGKLSVKSFKVVSLDSGCFDEFSSTAGETEIRPHFDSELQKEEYKIHVSENGIDIYYGTEEGAFRAYTTLKQIIAQAENDEIGFLEIHDKPDFENRGYMLDISRGKIPNLPYLKKLVDILADVKYNQLQLYMQSFVFEYKSFPEYCKDTEPLTVDEIKELEEYCAKKFIKLVPNQNSFGHMGAWTQKEEIAPLAITGKSGKPSATLNPLKEETLELMDRIYSDVFSVFKADMVNIGMDETLELGMGETEEECKKHGVGKVYTDYLNKICRLVTEKYGKTPMFWDDIIFKHEEQIGNIPKNAVVMHWGYETEHHYDRNCRKLSEHGLRFYVCPGTSMWVSLTGRMNNAMCNIADAAECGKYYGAEGFLLTEWGDGGHSQFPAQSYIPLVFGASVSWNSPDHYHETGFEDRDEAVDLSKKYADRFIYGVTRGSLSDIIFRSGNYYLLEKKLVVNNTILSGYMRKVNKINAIDITMTETDKKCYRRIKEYMLDLKNELKEVCCDKIYLRQAEIGCDIVLLMSKLVTDGKSRETDEEIKRISKEFEDLWMADNRRSGMEIFLKTLSAHMQEDVI